VAILFVSQWESEGMDLTDLSFSGNQDALVAAVAAANPRTVVVIESGGAQIMPWLANVGAVLEAWYPGQRGGDAIANLLFGDINPSGKLPITFPASLNDLPHPTIAAPPSNSTAPFPVVYDEGFLVGYKYYDTKSITPLFSFGYGLSYTTFTLTNPRLTLGTAANGSFTVSVDVNNTGTLAGAEVAQVYLSLPASTAEPPKRLVGWQKVSVQPGQTQTVTIEVDALSSAHPLSYWDVNTAAWQIANGDYQVYVGNSSRDVTLIGLVHVGP
jgi:beta-glucosidase